MQDKWQRGRIKYNLWLQLSWRQQGCKVNVEQDSQSRQSSRTIRQERPCKVIFCAYNISGKHLRYVLWFRATKYVMALVCRSDCIVMWHQSPELLWAKIWVVLIIFERDQLEKVISYSSVGAKRIKVWHKVLTLVMGQDHQAVSQRPKFLCGDQVVSSAMWWVTGEPAGFRTQMCSKHFLFPLLPYLATLLTQLDDYCVL